MEAAYSPIWSTETTSSISIESESFDEAREKNVAATESLKETVALGIEEQRAMEEVVQQVEEALVEGEIKLAECDAEPTPEACKECVEAESTKVKELAQRNLLAYRLSEEARLRLEARIAEEVSAKEEARLEEEVLYMAETESVRLDDETVNTSGRMSVELTADQKQNLYGYLTKQRDREAVQTEPTPLQRDQTYLSSKEKFQQLSPEEMERRTQRFAEYAKRMPKREEPYSPTSRSSYNKAHEKVKAEEAMLREMVSTRVGDEKKMKTVADQIEQSRLEELGKADECEIAEEPEEQLPCDESEQLKELNQRSLLAYRLTQERLWRDDVRLAEEERLVDKARLEEQLALLVAEEKQLQTAVVSGVMPGKNKKKRRGKK